MLWKTPIPGEGCSSPIVSQGRVYLTTAYEGAQRHAWDRPTFWATVILSCCVVGLTLTQIPRACRFFSARPVLIGVLGIWTITVVGLTTVVLAEPRWFWQFADPWTGTKVVNAELPWVESLNLRPVIAFLYGSLALIFIGLTDYGRVKVDSPVTPPLLTCWLTILTLAVTVSCCTTLGLISCWPNWFFPASHRWLVWLVTGGLGLFALAGSIGWLRQGGKMSLLLTGVGFALAGWLFHGTPSDEFGNPLSLLNRIAYLFPALMLFALHAWVFILPNGRTKNGERGRAAAAMYSFLCLLVAMLGGIVFVRSNYLQAQSGVVRAVLCLDAQSGQVLWNTPIFVTAAEPRHSLNSLATPTPACDGERVYAYFGSGLAALSKNGQLLWLKRDADFASFIRYGAGSSVALAGDKIVIYRDSEFVGHGDHLDDDIQNQTMRKPSALTALDKITGAEDWSITPPFSHDSYMTPLVRPCEDQLEVIIATWKTLAGFSVRDGSLRWTCSYPMQQIVPSLAANGDCLFVTGGNHLPCPMMAVRAPSLASKEPATAQTIWFNRVTGGNIVSPVCWDGLVFSISHVGVLICQDAESGSIHWTKRSVGDSSPRLLPETASSTHWIRRGFCTSSPPTRQVPCWRPIRFSKTARPHQPLSRTRFSCVLPATSIPSAAANRIGSRRQWPGHSLGINTARHQTSGPSRRFIVTQMALVVRLTPKRLKAARMHDVPCAARPECPLPDA